MIISITIKCDKCGNKYSVEYNIGDPYCFYKFPTKCPLCDFSNDCEGTLIRVN
jgi:hypothetical protein